LSRFVVPVSAGLVTTDVEVAGERFAAVGLGGVIVKRAGLGREWRAGLGTAGEGRAGQVVDAGREWPAPERGGVDRDRQRSQRGARIAVPRAAPTRGQGERRRRIAFGDAEDQLEANWLWVSRPPRDRVVDMDDGAVGG
jgi:hypothetical protein